jgi:hypothetical protein
MAGAETGHVLERRVQLGCGQVCAEIDGGNVTCSVDGCSLGRWSLGLLGPLVGGRLISGELWLLFLGMLGAIGSGVGAAFGRLFGSFFVVPSLACSLQLLLVLDLCWNQFIHSWFCSRSFGS